MPTLQFKNNASTTLSGSINNSQTSITVINSSNFPVLTAGDYFYATMYEVSGSTEINIEIVKVTGTTGNVWTIVRAQDGTTARSRDGITTCYVENRMTAASAQLMAQRDNNLSDLANAGTARTNLGLGTMATQNAASVAITGGTISGVTIAGVDSTTTIADNADNTKKVAFEVSGVSAGTTRTLTVPNASGTIALTSDLTSGYQPLDSDLTAVAGLAANGIIARTGTGTMAVRSLAAPVAGFTITNSDGVSGNPTFALSNDLGAVEGINTTGFVRRTGVDTWSASAIVDGDLPGALTGKTYNTLTLTANATGFSVAGGTTSKTLTVSNSITLAGTDGTTITLPTTSGTVALNNQTMYIGTTALAINRASASLSLTGVNIDGSAGSATTATTATKATNLVGGNNTTLLGAIGYQSNTDTTTLLSPNVTATKQFLSQTGTGTNGAAPVWSAVSKSDVGLGNVENTALSTWAGSANITTLGTVATGTWNATTISIAKGGTGATTALAAFDALSPLTTLGDVIYHDGTDNVRLAGNTTTTRKFFRQTGSGAASAAPAWDTLTDPDIPTALTGKTYNGLTLTAAATGFTIAGGATSKTLTMSNTLTLAGTDGSTLNIGAGGTLGSAAYTASTAYAPAAGSTNIVTVGTITAGTWTGSAIGISYGGTGQTSKTAGYNALSPMTTLGDLEYNDGTNAVRLAGNTTTSKRFLTQTGTGTVSAAPGWNAIVDGDVPSALTGKTYNGLTLTANATGFQIAGGTTSKTLAVSNNLTLAGTDGSTLNIGAGGTLGSAAYTASTAYAPAAGSASVTTLGTVTTGTWNATAIGAAYGGTGHTTYTIGDILYASGTTALSKLAGVATGNALISGGVGAAPAWGKIGLTTHVSGTLPIANGGTNSTATPTNGGVSYGTGTAFAFTAAGTAKQALVSNGAAAPTWATLDMTYLPAAPWKETVRVATTADLGASTFAAGVLTGFDDVVSLNVTTTLSSTTATTTSTAGLKAGAVISGNANIPAATTVASITNATTFVMSAAATATASTVATTFTQTIAALAVDGVTLALNDRVLVKNQTSAAQNGIYYLSTLGSTTVPWVLTRVAGGDTSADIAASVVGVDQGTTFGGDLWTTTFKTTDTINTTAMNWYEVLDTNNTVTLLNKTMSTGSVWNGTAVGAAYGGTGQTTYAVGDLLYASAATTISKLADVATGNVLLSGGVGVAPSYGKVGLTTHVTGTLPAANGGTGVTANTGTGNNVLSASPTLTGTVTLASMAPSGNIAFSGTGNRITGDFSQLSPISNRVIIQSSTLNGNTVVTVVPNGTAVNSGFLSTNNSDPTNASTALLRVNATEMAVVSGITGTGTYLPMIFMTNNAEQMRILTGGNVGIGTTNPGQKLTVAGTIESTSGGVKFPDGTTQATAASGITAVLQAAYPVGSIYINATNSTNPATLLGFGTWAAFGAGRVIVGYNASDPLFDAAEETGGSKDAVVVSHTHTATSTVTDPGHSHTLSPTLESASGTDGNANRVSGGSYSSTVAVNSATTGISVATSITSTGSTATNANLQPYITVYMWKRTA